MKKKYIIIGIFLILGLLIFSKTLSELKETRSVKYKSAVLDYDNKVPGSFAVNNSAEWISKDKAKITLDIKPIIKEKDKAKDIVFVLDVSGSMDGEKIAKVKKDVKEMARLVLANKANRVALISFESGAKKLSEFTNNIDEFIKKIDNLDANGMTNYKAALDAVDNLLDGYKQEDGKSLTTLFLTDGFPSEDTPNEVAVYKKLKDKYPYMGINAIQYEMGEEIQKPIKDISDKQYYADMEGLNNVLFVAGSNPVSYDKFIIKDYISKHFIGDVSTLKVSVGTAKLNGDELIWDLGNYSPDMLAKLEIEITLTGNKEEFYKVNKGVEINTSFENNVDNILSSKTPILKGTYNLIYDANAPQGCTVEGLEKTEKHGPFEAVKLVKGSASCKGYLFNGYKPASDIKFLNDDYFEMPGKDITLKAVWSKVKVNKEMNGKVYNLVKLYDKISKDSLGNDKSIGINYSRLSSSTNGEGIYLFDETKNDTFPVYFFRGSHKLNNNLIYGGFCWKIVRTTETGGVRLLYNGKSINGACTNIYGPSTQIGEEQFNTYEDKPMYIGYMYGDDLNPYTNLNESKVKKYIDKWYIDNIKGKDIETKIDTESIYCNDRTITSEEGDKINFAAYLRHNNGKPAMKCPLKDSFSIKKGNKKLTYPIGLLSGDDAIMAGTREMSINENCYLYNEKFYWLMTPAEVDKKGLIDVLKVFGNDAIHIPGANSREGVRPSITVLNSTVILSGTGSKEDPYII